ncbi:putative heavy-metal-binding-domain-containing protein [Lobosporangium transversale]|uniref:Putative heavy-metal-binding-domain-containing protein n=1 Tax=Lobosporangium transversale TaxID=64571 RepID=A0A1Y2GPW1_9FUNG|nr:putative heavy-metal-binding-domain-containing protein [Lobosporangium transversale]ORZ18329.1 putative heavy-metal-binding-domain-containing protein [Lobosporangium transversale]|eukprot:XP_021882124.1 putative heavy-metal-binding-domain-containing protein [Lobosporangium transversale]
MAQPVRSVDRRFTTTAFTYPGYHIAACHGVVRGLTVRNPNAGKAVIGAFASLAGGESSTYIEMAEKARERAFLRMLEHAAAAGGNAVIGVQFTGQEIIQRMTEVMAYGTAVTLVPAQQVVPQQAMSPQPIYNASPYSQPASPYSQAPLQQPTGSIQVQQQPFSPPKN